MMMAVAQARVFKEVKPGAALGVNFGWQTALDKRIMVMIQPPLPFQRFRLAFAEGHCVHPSPFAPFGDR
jgi:hypothetical protein